MNLNCLKLLALSLIASCNCLSMDQAAFYMLTQSKSITASPFIGSLQSNAPSIFKTITQNRIESFNQVINPIIQNTSNSISNIHSQQATPPIANSLLSHLTIRNTTHAILGGAMVYGCYSGYKNALKYNEGNRQISKKFENQKNKDKELQNQLNTLKNNVDKNTSAIGIFKKNEEKQAKALINLTTSIQPIELSISKTIPEKINSIEMFQDLSTTTLNTTSKLQKTIIFDDSNKQLKKIERTESNTYQKNNKKITTITNKSNKNIKLLDKISNELDITEKNINEVSKIITSQTKILEDNSPENKAFISSITAELINNKKITPKNTNPKEGGGEDTYFEVD